MKNKHDVIVFVLTVVILCTVSYFLTVGSTWVFCKAVHLEFSWLLGTAVWLVLWVLAGLFKK